MPIPIDIRQFGIKTIFVATTSIAVGFALFRLTPHLGLFALLGIISFWIGSGFLFLSDLIDNRPIDERKIGSQALNLLGIIFVAASFIALCYCLLWITIALLVHFTRVFTG